VRHPRRACEADSPAVEAGTAIPPPEGPPVPMAAQAPARAEVKAGPGEPARAGELSQPANPPGINRRSFLLTLGAIAAAAATPASAANEESSGEDPYGVLVDTTRCVGCRTCEASCAEANGLPPPDLADDAVFQSKRTTSENQFTAVSRFETEKGEVYVKRQCMHCLRPACASACLTRAMLKTRGGPVVWREPKCMGCRFCMVSCPFDGPKFEYHSATPRIRKCQMCFSRLREGKVPACVETCPAEALVFGKRRDLLQEARRRIQANPDTYVNQVYGEQEVGGTSWLYLAAVPFDQLGFRVDLGETPYPKLTEGFLYSVPIVLATLPAALAAISRATKRAEESPEPEIRYEPRESESPARV